MANEEVVDGRRASTTRTYNRILEYEERLDKLRFDMGSSFRAGDHNRVAWLEARHSLRMLHEELIVSDCAFVARSQLMTPFWMRMYYTPVEQVRTFLGRLGKAPQEGKSLGEEEQIKMDLIEIIDEGVGFFMCITYRLREYLNFEQISPRPMFSPCIDEERRRPPVEGLSTENSIKGVLYECLIFMGDLFRYRAIFSEDECINFGGVSGDEALAVGGSSFERGLVLATGKYQDATRLLPSFGHAFNQLAVISCMRDDVMMGMAYYLRAVMSCHAFPKSADNLLTLCRKMVTAPVERLGLADDAAMAALLGLMLKLVSAVIVHEMSRTAQSVHLDGIRAALGKLLCLPEPGIWHQGRLSEAESENLTVIVCCMILACEFLQRKSSAVPEQGATEGHLNVGQMRILEWLFAVMGKSIMQMVQVGDVVPPSVAIFSLWLVESKFLERLKNSTIEPVATPSLDKSLSNLWQAYAEVGNTFFTSVADFDKFTFELRRVPGDWLLFGTRSLGAPSFQKSLHSGSLEDDAQRSDRLAWTVKLLVERFDLLVLDVGDDAAARTEGLLVTKEEHDKRIRREMLSTKLAKQRLANQIAALQQQHQQQHPEEGEILGRTPPHRMPQTEAFWHLLDAESLVEYWDRIEVLVTNGALRLIITLSTLRYLDFAKGDTVKARKIMRFIAAETRKSKGSCHVHLQHPNEAVEPPGILAISTTGLSKHHRAIIGAARYFAEESNGWSPLVVLTTDLALHRLLEDMGIDCITDIATYLRVSRTNKFSN